MLDLRGSDALLKFAMLNRSSRLPFGLALLPFLGCAGPSSPNPAAPTHSAVVTSISESTLIVPPATGGGVRASNLPPRLVLRTTPALDTSTSPPTLRGTAPLAVHFNLCGSSDSDPGDSLNWQFHFGDSGAPPFGPDGAFRPDFDHQCRVDHTYREGEWTATLSVTDKHLADQSRGEPRALARTTTQVRVVATGTEPPPTSPGSPSGPTGPAFRFIFATSQEFDGYLGGLTGADAKCQTAAQNASLPGTYKAWLSDDTGSPSTRFIQSTVPYRNVAPGGPPAQSGSIVANNWADLTDGSLETSISTVSGTPSSTYAWTYTLPNGTPGGTLGSDCDNWSSIFPTGSLGHFAAADANWTNAARALDCREVARLICVQQ